MVLPCLGGQERERVEATAVGGGMAAAASRLRSLMLNPSGLSAVLAQPALGTAAGLVVVVAATGFPTEPTLAPLPAQPWPLPRAVLPQHVPSRSPRSGRAGDGGAGTFVKLSSA